MNGAARRLTRGGEHTTQYTDDVVWNRTSETCHFINQCHPNTFNVLKNVCMISKAGSHPFSLRQIFQHYKIM